MLRTPLLPIEEFLKLSSPAADVAESAAAGGARAFAREHLRRWVKRPEVREALWIASPEFLQSLAAWWSDPESAKGRRLEQTLYRYLARMTARATPFGAFAGCSTGRITDSTHLELDSRSQYRRHTRLDMEYLCGLADHLSADPAWRSNLRFRSNSTLHMAAGRYHHVRTDLQEGDRVFQLVATDSTPALDATLLRASSSTTDGATASELVSALVAGDKEITTQEADGFIGRLIDSQLLVADVMPPVTGAEAIMHMIEQLEQAKATDLAAQLRAVAEGLHALDQRGLGAEPAAYEGIANVASRLGGGFRPGRLVQVDVSKPAVQASLDRRVVRDILGAVATLHSIRNDAVLNNSVQPALQQFKEEFRDRYQEQEVPLLQALDDEAGIGFEQEDNPTLEPLLTGIDFRRAEETPDAGAEPLPPLVRRLEELRAKNETVLNLDPSLLNELKVADPLPLPDAFCVMGASFCLPGGQPGFCAHSVFGPSGANLLARFRHAGDRLAEFVQAHVRAEEALHTGDAVFAEIAHLPEGRAGNVVCRPVLRRYEIPLLATAGVPADRQIALSDLTVSLRDGRIVLRSRRLGVEVVPRLTSAHNFASSRSLKLYKFLCMLQHQDTLSDLFWDWGSAAKVAFLPRVTLGNIVLSLARWQINKETAFELTEGRVSIAAWRRSSLVPRFAFIAEFDNQLLIDFENALAVETFLEHIRKQEETVLLEMFPPPDALSVRGPEGSFVHEMILPFERVRSALAVPVKQPSMDGKHSASSAVSLGDAPLVASVSSPPNPDWLFAKLYCSPSHADRLLLELVQPLVSEIKSASTADRWFFMRYGDPNWHLRVRFHGHPAILSARVLPRLQQFVDEHERRGTLWRVQFDAYEPEVERYGGPLGMSVAENLFQLDSEFCLDLLPLVSDDAGADLRWHLACCGVDRLLSALGLTLEEKESLTKNMARSREEVFVVDQDYKQQMAQTFRAHRKTLAAILSQSDAAEPIGPADEVSAAATLPDKALAALARYSAGLRPIRKQLEDLSQANTLTKTVSELAMSFAHMHLNRIFRSRHVEQEAVVCDLLSRAYASRLARRTLARRTLARRTLAR